MSAGRTIRPVIPHDFRAMTIRQPYPFAIQRGLKRGETRSRPFSYRGWVGIHAARKWAPGWGYRKWVDGWSDPRPDDDQDTQRAHMLIDLGVHATEDTEEGRWWWLDRWSLPLGAIVAVAEVVDCVPIVGEDGDLDRESLDVACVEHRPAGASNAGLWLWPAEDEGEDMAEPADITTQLPWGDFTPGRFLVLFGDVVSLARPVPAKGSLAMPWRVPDDVAAKVREQVEGGAP